MEKIDYKKEYKDLYLPKTNPMLIDVPSMKFIMVEGTGNPNDKDGEYQEAMQILYGLSFTIKMSKMGQNKIEGYFEYVVPPLEGLWWQEGIKGIEYSSKETFKWISMIRQPEFVTKEVFEWAATELKKKKGIDSSKAKFKKFKEGLCVQVMHLGSYDDEPETIKKIKEYIKENNLKNDIGRVLEDGMIRQHHEIYLSDPRRVEKNKLKTVIRYPVIKEER